MVQSLQVLFFIEKIALRYSRILTSVSLWSDKCLLEGHFSRSATGEIVTKLFFHRQSGYTVPEKLEGSKDSFFFTTS